jgi:hypothetical protein
MLFKGTPKRFTQAELSNYFSITEVTLRNRMKDAERLMNIKKFREIISELAKILKNYETLKDSIYKENQKLNIVNMDIQNLIYQGKYDDISGLIKNLRIKYKEQNISCIVPALELASKLYNKVIIISIINFLINHDYHNEKIFNNFIRLIVSEDKEIVNLIIKYIYFEKPKLEGADIFKILDNLNREQNIQILKFIQSKEMRYTNYYSIMDYIKKKYNFFQTD